MFITGIAYNMDKDNNPATCQEASCMANYSGNLLATTADYLAKFLLVCNGQGQIPRTRCYSPELEEIAGSTWNALCSNETTCAQRQQNGSLDDAFFLSTLLKMLNIPFSQVLQVAHVWDVLGQSDDWQILDPSQSPQAGDIAVWVTSNAGSGHVAIITRIDGNGISLVGADNPAAFMNATRQSGGQLNSPLGGTLQGYIRIHVLESKPVIKGNTQDFFCTALPYAKLANQWIATRSFHPGKPLPSHTWYISVILAQWGIETGFTMPTFTGYNFGNVSAIPGEPSVKGLNVAGSPPAFAYANTPLDGVRYYVYFTQFDNYKGVADAYPQGAIQQAYALAASPWSAEHYNQGKSLIDTMNRYNLQSYDSSSVTCSTGDPAAP
jgi:hypothetical protein